jgi:hypothetical protein
MSLQTKRIYEFCHFRLAVPRAVASVTFGSGLLTAATLATARGTDPAIP